MRIGQSVDPALTGARVWERISSVTRGTSILAGLVLLCVVFAVASPRFLTVGNLFNIVGEAAVVGLLALGMTFVLITAGIDLSVGSTVTITTVVLGVMLVSWGLPTAMALLLTVAIGGTVGLVNGAVVAHLRVPPLITTLGTLSIIQGFASFITGGAITSLRGFPSVAYLGQGRLGPVPVPAIILIIVTVACWVLLTKTTFGTNVRAIGTNHLAAYLMGLRVKRYIVTVYCLSGMLASVAGIIVAARLAASSSQAGAGLELSAIAAAVLGGTSLFGGSGSIVGSMAGALFLSVLFNGLILMGVPFFVQLVVTGLVMIIAIMLNQFLIMAR